MIFSKACEYGIKATLYIAKCSLHGQRVSLKAIAYEIDSPVAFTAKILQNLAKRKIIISAKGPSGGFEMDEKKLHQTTLHQVVEAIDGTAIFTQCGLGLHECSELYPCPFHEKFKMVRNGFQEMLDSTKIYDMAMQLEVRKAYLKRN